jgi:hypothetical protein
MALPSGQRLRTHDRAEDSGVTAEEKTHLLGSPRSAPAWEYRILSPATISDLEQELNELGAQGYEVVGVATAFKQAAGREVPFLVLKRPRSR